MLKPTLLLLCLPLILSGLALSEAFQSGISGKTLSAGNSLLGTPTPTAMFHRRLVEVHLKAPKKKEIVKEQIGDDPVKMFLAFANPTRNPNSIFVYMLMTLYALGKYSESHPPGM